MAILVGQMLQFSSCAVFCRLLPAVVRERPGAGLVNTGEQEPGAGGWGAAILLMNPGLAAVSWGGEYCDRLLQVSTVMYEDRILV